MSLKNKKIFVINNGLDFGGIQIASVNFANYCDALGYSVVLMAMYKTEHEIQLSSDIKFYEPNYFRRDYNKIIYSFKIGYDLRKTLIKENPDVIISHGEWESGFTTMVSTGLKMPIFIQNHMNPDLKFNFLHETFNKLFYPRANGVIALTEHAANVIGKRYNPKRVGVIPNPIRFISRLDVPKEKRIVTIGRLSKEKGHKYLLEAVSKMDLGDWMIDIVGDGPEMESLLTLAAELSIKDKVCFHGMQKDVSRYLNRSQIFILPSLSEAFPLALIEAMSFGLACVATDCLAGNSIIIRNEENGLVVSPGNSDQLANSMMRLINDELLRDRLSKQASSISTILSEEKVYGQYLKFIMT